MVDVGERDVHEVLPERDRRRVAGLQRDDAAAGRVRERGVLVEARLRLAVERPERLEVVEVLGVRVQHVLGQHPELRAPIAQVVHPDHVVAGELERAHDRVADHGRAQVPDVHLLGHVGRGVVDRDRLRGRRERDAEARIGQRARPPRRQRLGREREVDEPRPGDLRRRQQAARVAELLRHPRGHVARRLAELLGQLHGEVGLQVEPRLARDREQRVDVTAAGHALDRGDDRRRQGMAGGRVHPYDARATRRPGRGSERANAMTVAQAAQTRLTPSHWTTSAEPSPQ